MNTSQQNQSEEKVARKRYTVKQLEKMATEIFLARPEMRAIVFRDEEGVVGLARKEVSGINYYMRSTPYFNVNLEHDARQSDTYIHTIGGEIAKEIHHLAVGSSYIPQAVDLSEAKFLLRLN